MICQQCQSENPNVNKFCGSCGTGLAATVEPAFPEAATVVDPSAPVPVPGEPGAWFCAKHKKAITRLRCGRCESPICPKCIVYTPGGTRCRTCAKNKVAVRPLGVLNEAGRVIDNAVSSRTGNPVWYMAIWYFILSLFRGFGD